MTAGYVYTCYDATGDPIYIGCTRDLFLRMENHTYDSWWAPQVVKVRAKVYPTIAIARTEEAKAISEVHPRWNIHRLAARRTWTARHFEDYVTASFMRGNWSLKYKASSLARMQREYRIRFGGELLLPVESTRIPA